MKSEAKTMNHFLILSAGQTELSLTTGNAGERVACGKLQNHTDYSHCFFLIIESSFNFYQLS